MSRNRLAVALVIILAAASTALAQETPKETPKPESPLLRPTPAEPELLLPGLRPAPHPLVPGDAFGLQVAMPEHTIIYLNGHTAWDVAFESMTESFRSLKEYFDKQGLKASGPALTIYTDTDDSGFSYRVAYPVAEAPKDPPKGDLALGTTPTGRALKFVHRGPYDAMDATYEAITNYLDEKNLEAKDLFVEEYTTDPVTTAPDNLVINVYVPLK